MNHTTLAGKLASKAISSLATSGISAAGVGTTNSMTHAVQAFSDFSEQCKNGGEILWKGISTLKALSESGNFFASERVSGGDMSSASSDLQKSSFHHQFPSNLTSASSKDFAAGVLCNEDLQGCRCWGNANFVLQLKEVDEKGRKEMGVVTAEAVYYEDDDPQKAIGVPCSFKWYHSINGAAIAPAVFVESDFRLCSSYRINADSIGASLLLEATPLSSKFSRFHGTAYCEIGPIQVDPQSRQILDNGIANGSLRFPCKLYTKDAEIPVCVNDEDAMPQSPRDTRDALSPSSSVHRSFSKQGGKREKIFESSINTRDCSKDVVIHIMVDEIRCLQPDSDGKGYSKQFSSRYGSKYPLVKLQPSNNTKFKLLLGKEEENCLHLEAYSRHQRDLIALAIRCFHARFFIATSAILDTVLGNSEYTSGKLDTTHTRIDLMSLINKLLLELNSSIEKVESYRIARDKAIKEKSLLEEDMTHTINLFQKQIEENEEILENSRILPSEGSSSLSEQHKNEEDDQLRRSSEYYNLKITLKHQLEEIQQLKDVCEKLKEEGAKKSSQIAELEMKHERKNLPLQDEMSYFEVSRKDLNLEIHRLREELEYFYFEEQSWKVSRNEMEQAAEENINKQMKKVEMLQAELNEISIEASRWKGIAHDKETLLDSLRSELNTAKDSVKDLESKVVQAERHLNSVKSENEAKISAFQGIGDELKVENNRLRKKNDSLSKEFQKSIVGFETSYKDSLVKLNSSKEMIASLKEEISEYQEEKKNYVLLIEEYKKKLEGVLGKLAALEREHSESDTADTTMSEGNNDDNAGKFAKLMEAKDEDLRKLSHENLILKARLKKLSKSKLPSNETSLSESMPVLPQLGEDWVPTFPQPSRLPYSSASTSNPISFSSEKSTHTHTTEEELVLSHSTHRGITEAAKIRGKDDDVTEPHHSELVSAPAASVSSTQPSVGLSSSATAEEILETTSSIVEKAESSSIDTTIHTGVCEGAANMELVISSTCIEGGVNTHAGKASFTAADCSTTWRSEGTRLEAISSPVGGVHTPPSEAEVPSKCVDASENEMRVTSTAAVVPSVDTAASLDGSFLPSSKNASG